MKPLDSRMPKFFFSSFKILQFYNLNNNQGFTLLACFLLLPVLIDLYQVPVSLKDKTLV